MHACKGAYLHKRINLTSPIPPAGLNMLTKNWHIHFISINACKPLSPIQSIISSLINYQELLQMSSLPDLATRWKHLGLYYFYKLANGHFEFPYSPLSLRSLNYPNRDGRSNLYVQPHASSNAFHHSFFPSTISLWNSLPLSIATAPTFNSFKRQLLNSL